MAITETTRLLPYLNTKSMMTSSNGSIFRVTGNLCGEFTGPRWIPHTKASAAELCVLRCYRAHYDVTVMFASDWYRAHLLVWDLQVSSDDLASWVTVPDVVMWCSRTCFAIHAVLLIRNEPAINLTSILYIIRWYVWNASFAHLQMKRIHMYNDVQKVLTHPISNNVGTYLKSSRKNGGHFGWTL